MTKATRMMNEPFVDGSDGCYGVFGDGIEHNDGGLGYGVQVVVTQTMQVLGSVGVVRWLRFFGRKGFRYVVAAK